ncbi:hypothetical protein GF361_03030 [Candidatus Woesearchaeota archaeon]|nr:hypothetical protein [Candidatus Woesearchaeota archaeon]
MTNEQDKPNIQEDYPGLKSEQDKLILNFNTLKQIIESGAKSGAINPDELVKVREENKALQRGLDESEDAIQAYDRRAEREYADLQAQKNKTDQVENELESVQCDFAQTDAEYKQFIAEKDRELAELRVRLRRYESRNTDMEGRLTDANNRVDELKDTAQELHYALQDQDNEIDQKDRELESVQCDLAKTDADYKDRLETKDRAARRVIDMYKNRTAETEDTAQELHYALQDQDKESDQKDRELESIQADFCEESISLQDRVAIEQHEKAHFIAKFTEADTAIQNLRDDYRTQEAILKELQKQANNINSEIAILYGE